jgi:iron(III) transport system substrate-binding protein
LIGAALAVLGAPGCWRFGKEPRVVVYTALDSDFSAPIFERFEESSGIAVLPKYDVESTKTVGLVNRILAESDRPRCDVFWNNEILNTLRLAKRGLLEPYTPPGAAQLPAMYRAADGAWHGFAARARVLVVNRDLVADADRPQSIHDLLDPRWRGKVGIAKPLFGTTATHAACLFAHLGDDRAKEFFRRLKQNGVQILSGNKQVALAAASGQIAFGLTDTDDALIEQEHGRPVEIVYPDRRPDQMGTLFIPNTLAILKNCPNPEAARRLVDYLLSPEVEAALAAGPSAQVPLNPRVRVALRVESPFTIKAMQVDFREAADRWETAARFIRDEFTAAE